MPPAIKNSVNEPVARKVPRNPLVGPILAVAVFGGAWWALSSLSGGSDKSSAPPPPKVTVSTPIQKDLSARIDFLGQFSAVDDVELKAQVGGRLTEIHFKDGDIVQKGDFLFVIDPVPYEIKLAQAKAQLDTAQARLALANKEYTRAAVLKRTDPGSISTQNVDQRLSEQRAAQAAVDDASAQVRDAQFDLNHCHIVSPITGRIGNHLVSVGNLVAGSRYGSGSSTLLATIVSEDPIYLNFDMPEADYLTFKKSREKATDARPDKVEFNVNDEESVKGEGVLDFVDNRLDRSSGTIHARATVPNAQYLFTAGEFARVRLNLGHPVQSLLVPDAAVLPDQSEHIVLTVSSDNTVVPKIVEIGYLQDGLRVIRSGLEPKDKVIIEGMPFAAPGSKVEPQQGNLEAKTNSDAK